MKTLLYASPFPPKKSGISDYSETMVYGLKKYFDVTLLTDDYRLSNEKLYEDFDVKVYGRDKIDFNRFDSILYNAGNCAAFHKYIYDCALKHPGFIILHDLVLYYLTLEYYRDRTDYYSKIREIAGPETFFELKLELRKGKELLHCGPDIAVKAPLNKELLLNSKGVIVHSQYSKDKLLTEHSSLKVLKIGHPSFSFRTADLKGDHLKNTFGIDDSAFVIASFGAIHATRHNDIVCRAVKRMNSESKSKIYYVMVGTGDFADGYLDSHIIKTGYVPQDLYDDILSRCDIVVGLRYPSMGETSGSLIRALSAGKPSVVTDDAWFSELPDDSVIKMDMNASEDDIYEKLRYFAVNRGQLKNISDSASRYINGRPGLDEECKKIRDLLTLRL